MFVSSDGNRHSHEMLAHLAKLDSPPELPLCSRTSLVEVLVLLECHCPPSHPPPSTAALRAMRPRATQRSQRRTGHFSYLASYKPTPPLGTLAGCVPSLVLLLLRWGGLCCAGGLVA